MARITGMFTSMGVALGATARAFNHAMLQVINDALSWKSIVVIPPSGAAELHFWLEEFDQFNGAPFHVRNSYDAVIHVDASSHGWGSTLTTFSGGREEASTTMSEPLRATSSTRREIEGVLWALQMYANKIKQKHILLRVDNQGVFFILRKGGSHSPDLTTACKSIIRACMELGTRLIIEWIPRELNSHADELSKMVDHDDYTLKTPWLRIEKVVGVPTPSTSLPTPATPNCRASAQRFPTRKPSQLTRSRSHGRPKTTSLFPHHNWSQLSYTMHNAPMHHLR
ncbi:unnamed protein product [Closterium sp. NIES-54]